MNVQLGILFRAGATVTEQVKPADGKAFSLKELQRAVGGYIELIPGARPVAYCNEEGSLAGLPPNPLASATFGQPLVGDVIQITREDNVETKKAS